MSSSTSPSSNSSHSSGSGNRSTGPIKRCEVTVSLVELAIVSQSFSQSVLVFNLIQFNFPTYLSIVITSFLLFSSLLN
ncbi:hypothetical protein DFA_08351 [Cavenderia fasciculata]|uniref:Transmembrane protein n=1 Tax=Cavenderia fasciculata TaxID=261658 RepID=F4Q5U7_CACFS|nr:uncharacterized protein DFA_08351 [Cavenderia fasciculata]EGG17356.1 hypothetical protein DFA_08351 [Cavenderia fasciculata]|eukprot:XP_004355840.1 hypothetical protein DFA_08351 [Cavenderia fasciculata]